MTLVIRCLCIVLKLDGIIACSEFETSYFKDRVNEATMERVAKRYGTPHKTEQIDGSKTVWTYFERGSGTASFSGTSRGGTCRAYVLVFDQNAILREWKQDECQN